MCVVDGISNLHACATLTASPLLINKLALVTQFKAMVSPCIYRLQALWLD